MKKQFLFAALLSSFFLASCDKEKVDPTPAVAPVTATANATVGESIIIRRGTSVPAGWVITSENLSNNTYTITYTVGAPVLYSLAVLRNSPIPNGWVVTSKFADGRLLIVCLKGAPVFYTIDVLRTISPIPPRYIITRDDALFQITNLNGARRGARVQATRNSPIPTGWRVVSPPDFVDKLLENTQDF